MAKKRGRQKRGAGDGSHFKRQHDCPDDPIIIVSEIDAERWEHRKVEIWADGRKGFADQDAESGGTFLGTEPWPDLDQIASDPEFELRHITRDDFEREWARRQTPEPPPE